MVQLSVFVLRRGCIVPITFLLVFGSVLIQDLIAVNIKLQMSCRSMGLRSRSQYGAISARVELGYANRIIPSCSGYARQL